MNHSPGDPDDLIRKKVDLNHVRNMSYQMHVPDSIIVGPSRATIPRAQQDNDRLPPRMEVPDSIRLGAHGNTGINFPVNPDTSDSTSQQLSFQQSDMEVPSDDEYSNVDTPRNYQPIKIADSWHIEPFTNLDDRNVLNEFQLLQNRIHHIERNLARRDFRDRIVYTCLIGYIVLQTLLSVRRSMLN